MTQPDTSIAPVVQALDAAYNTLAQEFDLPPVTIVVASGRSGKTAKHGHFHARQYVPFGGAPENRVDEILIAAESFQREPHETFGTLVHEAAHVYCFANQIKDTSRNGRYHNKRFKAEAERMGLCIGFDSSIGHSPTTVPQETQDKYASQIAAIDKATRVFRDTATPQASAGKSRNNPKYACECGYIMRMSRNTYAMSQPSCSECGTCFEEVTD